MSDVDALRAAVERLEAAYRWREQQLRKTMTDPLDAVDPNGRSILLDALTAIVTARTALAGR